MAKSKSPDRHLASANITAFSTTASRRRTRTCRRFRNSIKPVVTVKQSDIIALSGNTGLSTGPHLHFEFYLNREAVDPFPHTGSEVQATAPTGGPVPAVPMVVAVGGASSGVTAGEIAAFPTIKSYIDNDSLAAEIDTFLKPLRHAHRAPNIEAQFVRCVALQLAGDKRRQRPALLFARLHAGN